MTRTATTIEQGRKLLEQGVSPETADMCYVNGILEEDEWAFFRKHYDGEIFPAWSADALAGLMRNAPEKITYNLFGEAEYEEKKPIKAAKRSDIVNWQDISSSWTDTKPSEMTFVDCFCGAGGLSKGLEMAGLQGICGLDWFKEAGMTYHRNFHHPFVLGDITTQKAKNEFYSTVEQQLNGRKLSLVAGGFPCQGFSMAGNRIVDDPRNSLYRELLEVVKNLNPDYVLCENVKGLRSMLGGKVEEKILSDFKEIGYEMHVTTLCAADYYVPQKRERVIFIGNKIGKKIYYPKPILTPDKYVTTGQAIEDLMTLPSTPEFNHVPTRHRPDMAERMAALPEGQSLYKGYSDAWKKCPWNEASCTIKENHGGVNIHPKLPRVLTAREMARLQSFPDDFIFEGTKNKQLVQIGNAVPPLLAKAIGLAIRYSAGDLTGEKEYKR
ncbi:DNA cytosine methyltransferase [Prevotella sp. HUN102]|uniref:DNA cytosine methyltransferase n=1 Tax=Prevotella sp. HUN102 TaxID=1392486 RepID=UPI00068DDC83|nr:DNA cytosine methyltransferase [Prevotella sp. HUN102]